tara:strand:- start:4609 stop:5355 length:747 start_codon:yes stop_codon:yes gene_type:complete
MKSSVIIGNGASLKEFDFTKIDREKYNVIGCCLAFRHWDKIDWYPDIYVNADDVVIKNPEVIEFIKKKKCNQYIVSNKLKEVWKEYPKDGTILFIQDMMCVPNSCFKYVKNYCSGTASLITSMDISLDISILGMDNDYVEFLPECKKLEDGTLEITETPEDNPNYFFNDYQRKGDIYNVPNGQTIHKSSWFESRVILDFLSTMYPESKPRVTNYNLKEKESIGQFFLTRPLNKFDYSPMEYINDPEEE